MEARIKAAVFRDGVGYIQAFLLIDGLASALNVRGLFLLAPNLPLMVPCGGRKPLSVFFLTNCPPLRSGDAGGRGPMVSNRPTKASGEEASKPGEMAIAFAGISCGQVPGLPSAKASFVP